EAPLLTPSQQFFLRQNLKLRLLAARFDLLFRDQANFRADLGAAEAWLKKYFDTRVQSVQQTVTLLLEVKKTEMVAELPGLASSLGAVRVLQLAREKKLRGGGIAAVRILFWFLLVAAIAVAAALAAKLTHGYALLVAPPYRIELSLNLLVILVLGSFFLLYLLSQLMLRTMEVPARVRAWRAQQKRESARTKQDAAILALLEGRYGKAQQVAQEALALPYSSGLAALIAARAAIDVRQFDKAESFLSRSEAQPKSLAVPRLTLSAESALEQGQPQ